MEVNSEVAARRTVVLADDHQLVRAGLRSLIDDYDDYRVIGEADDGEQAVALAQQLQPALMVLDITMPRLNGIDALPRIKQASAQTRVLMLSMYDSGDFVMRALRAGADGYLLKDAAAVELTLALDALWAGRQYLSPAVSSTVVERAIASATATATAAAAAPAPPQVQPHAVPLTPRQVEILKLLASGKSTKEIAFELGLSAKTVETHRAQIMERLNIRDLPRLVLYAVRMGLVSPDR